MSETQQATCPEKVHERGRGFGVWTCGKPVKRDGLCGTHAAARDKRKERDAAATAERKASAANREEVTALLAELGIDGYAEFEWRTSKYTGNVVVSADTLRKLAGA